MTRRMAATTSRSGRTTPRSGTRCRRCPSGSGRWGSPRPISWRGIAGRSGWPSLGLERQGPHQPRQVRPRLAAWAGNRLEGGRMIEVRWHALRNPLLERRHVLVLVEHADWDAVPPFEPLLGALGRLLFDRVGCLDNGV